MRKSHKFMLYPCFFKIKLIVSLHPHYMLTKYILTDQLYIVGGDAIITI